MENIDDAAGIDQSGPKTTGCEHKILTSTDVHYLTLHFAKACQQVSILGEKLNRLIQRNKAAESRPSLKSIRYSYRLQMIAIEGTRSMFYNYASLCRSRLDELERQQSPST